jgi:hypothetical protein
MKTPTPEIAGAGAAETVRDALLDSQYLAGVTAGWNAAQADDPNAALASLQKSRAGHLAGYKEARAILAALNARAGEAMVRVDRNQYPEIIQAARWSDEDSGTNHFEPGIGFVVDDPDGLLVPTRWVDYLPVIEEALRGLDHERPHPEDVDTLEYLARDGKEPSLTYSAAYCFVCGEQTPMMAMATSSEGLWIASRFLNEYFEGWLFDPASGYSLPAQPSALGEG